MTTYKIIRMFRDGAPPKRIKGGLTLEEAQVHCERDDTRGDGWFDGFDEENPSPETLLARRERDRELREGIARVMELME